MSVSVRTDNGERVLRVTDTEADAVSLFLARNLESVLQGRSGPVTLTVGANMVPVLRDALRFFCDGLMDRIEKEPVA